MLKNLKFLFMEGTFETTACHQIISIFSKQKEVPKHKGHLFLGGVGALKQPIVANYRITAVLSIINESMFKYSKIKQKCQHLKMLHHKWIDLDDIQEVQIYPHLQSAADFIHEKLQEHNVLVHCQVGMSRSTTLVCAYLMKYKKIRFKDALQLVKSKRSLANPNQSFRKDLKRYDQQLFHL